MITVVCVFVKGHVDFTSEYVYKLKNMVAKSLKKEHRFICLTDQQLNYVETIRIGTPQGYYAWWAKLELFNPKHTALQSGTILYLDLDVLIVDKLDVMLAQNPGGFNAVPDDAPNFMGRDGRKVVKRLNSSVMLWEGGLYNHLYSDWDPEVTKRLWGDQDWIGEQLEHVSLMPLPWFPRLSQITSKGQVDKRMTEAKVVLCKKPKNAEAARLWPWFAKAWT